MPNSIIGLTAPNAYLYKKADAWLKWRLQNGMVEEVENLLKKGVPRRWLENLGLEYRWLVWHILDKLPKNEMETRLAGDIHALIRRQKTWFSKFPNVKLYDVSKNYKNTVEKEVEKFILKTFGKA